VCLCLCRHALVPPNIYYKHTTIHTHPFGAHIPQPAALPPLYCLHEAAGTRARALGLGLVARLRRVSRISVILSAELALLLLRGRGG